MTPKSMVLANLQFQDVRESREHSRSSSLIVTNQESPEKPKSTFSTAKNVSRKPKVELVLDNETDDYVTMINKKHRNQQGRPNTSVSHRQTTTQKSKSPTRDLLSSTSGNKTSKKFQFNLTSSSRDI